jgi:hypothetical protein
LPDQFAEQSDTEARFSNQTVSADHARLMLLEDQITSSAEHLRLLSEMGLNSGEGYRRAVDSRNAKIAEAQAIRVKLTAR